MTENTATLDSFEIQTEHRSLWVDVWRQFRKHKGALVGMFVFMLITFCVFIGPFIYDVDPNAINFRERNLGPSWSHLAVGFLAMLISLLIGSLIGVLAGFIKSLDGPLMRLTDLFLALPILPVLLVIIMLFRDTLRTLYGPEMGIFFLIVFVIGITSWMHTARIVRGDVLGIKEREFVTAAHSIGTRKRKIIFRHILPNILSPIMVSATLGVANAIITESALSFLGLGFPPDFPTWGRLLYDGATFIQITPSRVIWPGVFIALTVLSVNYIGDGLRDALDPRLRGR